MEVFITKQLKLLELEKEAEIEETRTLHEGVPSKELEHQGLCLRKLRVASLKIGLYGRILVKFEPEWTGKELPAHSITPGDIVGVGTTGNFGHKEVIITGVVWATKTVTLTIAFETSLDSFPLEDRSIYSLVKVANNVTYRRLKGALLDLKNYKGGIASQLIDILFGISTPSQPLVSLPTSVLDVNGELKYINKSLDESQCQAVKFALLQKDVAIIHGPPGTGKTTTVVEVICQLAAQGLKVLACAPSNVAVDNMVEKLAKFGVKLVRLGHPARTLQTNQNLSLDALLSRCDNYSLMKDIQKDMDNLMLKAGKSKEKGNKRSLQNEAKSLARDLKAREQAAITEVLKAADVVLATLSGAHPHGPLKHVPIDYFDCIIIDECSQALEAACWIPLLRAKKCVIAGDHLQLPPTIISEKAAKEGLEVTLMERILKFPYGSSVVRMLVTQYRMHAAIMQWPSDNLYKGRLVADESVKGHLLCDLSNIENNEDTSIPLLLIDTAGCNLEELHFDDDISKGNEGEARLVAIHVENLVKSGLSPQDIAVIAPYNLQVDILRKLLSAKYPSLEIKSVDGFQGREKEAVIISFTRSNEKGEVGFLAEDRRVNVAITRARRHLAIICDSETVSHHAFLKNLIEYMSSTGEVRSAHQYQDGIEASSNNHILPLKKIKPSCKSKESNKLHAVSKKVAKPSLTVTKPVSVQIEDMEKRNNAMTMKYQKILNDFVVNNTTLVHTFSEGLTSFERMLVHDIAEKLNLSHISQGEGADRFIVVSKKTSSTAEKGQPKRSDIAKLNTKSIVENEALPVDKNYPKMPASSEVNEPDEEIDKSDTKLDKQSTKKKKAKKLNNALDEIEDDQDLNSFLADLTMKDKTCNYHKCKTGITVLRQVCMHCKNAFCMQHFIPEVHGCGELARLHARQRIHKEGVITQGSGPKASQKLDPNKRAHLERKLEKKLSELGNLRTKKSTATDNAEFLMDYENILDIDD